MNSYITARSVSARAAEGTDPPFLSQTIAFSAGNKYNTSNLSINAFFFYAKDYVMKLNLAAGRAAISAFFFSIIFCFHLFFIPDLGALDFSGAELTSFSGEVTVSLSGADGPAEPQEGMKLESGDMISTGSGGSAELSFNEDNSNVVRLSENTTASVVMSGDEKLEMTEGEILASVSGLSSGSSFEIRTPTAVSGARGTDWVTKVSGDGTDVEAVDDIPYVKHFESEGKVSTEPVFINPGQMTTVRRFQRPEAPRPMQIQRRQQWQSMKQDVRKRAKEAAGKRGDRPVFDRNDFIRKIKSGPGRGPVGGSGGNGLSRDPSEPVEKYRNREDIIKDGPEENGSLRRRDAGPGDHSPDRMPSRDLKSAERQRLGEDPRGGKGPRAGDPRPSPNKSFGEKRPVPEADPASGDIRRMDRLMPPSGPRAEGPGGRQNRPQDRPSGNGGGKPKNDDPGRGSPRRNVPR